MISIELLSESDWPQVARIYKEGIETGEATFETTVPDWERFDQSHLDDCRLVAVDSETVIGWAALSYVSQRQVYRGLAEVSVYVSPEHRGRGVGRLLMQALVDESERCG